MSAATNLANIPAETKTIFTLPATLRTATVARASRAAFLAFCNGAEKWGKLEIACWLAGPYAEVTRAAQSLVDEPARASHPRIERVDPTQLAQVMRAAVASGRALLRASTFAEGGAIAAWDAWRRGLIARCEDAEGNEGWIPLDLPSMRLSDRILSLWAADYLHGADDYESYLAICDVCGAATFDPFLRAKGRCMEHTARHIEIEWPNGEHEVVSSHLSDAPRASSAPSSSRLMSKPPISRVDPVTTPFPPESESRIRIRRKV